MSQLQEDGFNFTFTEVLQESLPNISNKEDQIAQQIENDQVEKGDSQVEVPQMQESIMEKIAVQEISKEINQLQIDAQQIEGNLTQMKLKELQELNILPQHVQQNLENQQNKEFEEYSKELKQQGLRENPDEPELQIEAVFPAPHKSPVKNILKTETVFKSPEMISQIKPVELVVEDDQQLVLKQSDNLQKQVQIDEDEVIVLKYNSVLPNKKIQIIDIEEEKTNNQRQQKRESVDGGKLEHQNNNLIDIIEDSDSEKYLKRKPEKKNKNGFIGCSKTITKVAIVRFVGVRRVKLIIQSMTLKDVFQIFFSEKLLKGIIRGLKLNQILNSITPEDVYQYIGIKIMMGYMRFPQQGDYWCNDVILACPIRQSFEFKFFQQIDASIEINVQTLRNSMLTIKQEGASPEDDFLQEVTKKINNKFRKAIQPGQELILIQNQTIKTYTSKIEVYQLIEKESNFICGQIFRTQSENDEILQEKLKDLLKPFEQLNHIVYASPSLLNFKTINELYQNYIFVCTEVKMFPNIDSFKPQEIYQNGMAYYMRLNTESQILVFPNWQTLQSLQSVLTQVEKHFLSIEKMCLIGETATYQQITQTVFQIILENMVNNTLSVTNYSQIQKDGRVKLAQELLRTQMIPFEQQIMETPPPKQTHTVSIQTTETHRFPLEKVLHCPLFDGNARCLVCLYEGNLSKTQASCLGCSDTLQRKVYLCVYPCFRKFHIEPSLYINNDEARQIEGYYDEFQLEDEVEQVPASKPERNADLDIIYQMQHRDLEDEQQLLQYGVPVNYEDDFRNKTKWVKVTKPRGGAKSNRGGRSRAPSQPRKVNFSLSEQGVQGNSEQPPSALKKGGRGRGRGRPNERQSQRSNSRQPDPQEEGSAMMDFFSMVRKKVMTNNNQQQL